MQKTNNYIGYLSIPKLVIGLIIGGVPKQKLNIKKRQNLFLLNLNRKAISVLKVT